MLIFTTAYQIANRWFQKILEGVYTNLDAMYSLLAILIFISIAMFFIPRIERYATIFLIGSILLYVGIGFLQPYSGFITKVVGALVAVILLIFIKREIFRYVRKNKVQGWLKVILYLV